MNILLFIDSLGSGGAQKQLVNFACILKKKHHNVQVAVYNKKYDHFAPKLKELNIKIHSLNIENPKGFSRTTFINLYKLIDTEKFDIVSSYLTAPNIYTELVRIFNKNVKVVINERSSYLHSSSALKDKIKPLLCFLHIRADAVVSNSFHQDAYLKQRPFLSSKCQVIWNGYDPKEMIYKGDKKFTGKTKFLVVGRISQEKNGSKLVQAAIEYFNEYGESVEIAWAGRHGKSAEEQIEIERIKKQLSANPHISKNWKWLGELKNISNLYDNYDCVINLSKYEGLPNVVCEAMFKGCLVLASDVCDHPRLLDHGRFGYLCNPTSINSITSTLREITIQDRRVLIHKMNEARKFAEEKLSENQLYENYMSLFYCLKGIRKCAVL